MNSPYAMLDLPENASIEQVKAAYKRLLAQYSTFENEEVRNRIIQQIDEAYDSIILSKANSSTDRSFNNNAFYSRDYSDIIKKINSGRFDDAETLLDGIPKKERDAQWYYLKGRIQHSRGWLEQTYKNFKTAHEKDPHNEEYKKAYQNASKARKNNYGDSRNNSNSYNPDNDMGGYNVMCCNRDGYDGCGGCGDCDCCSICTGLMCMDACCDCEPCDCNCT